jgi:glycosyltransferase involved in cell wall biosynthesis
LSRRGFAAQLAIVGSGPDRKSLEALAKAEGVQENVFLTGFLRDPISVMEAADVILVCSRIEGFGRVTVEAMRLEKPVIAAASGGTLELVRDGFNGLLYEPGNPEQLADKLLLLAQSPSLRMKLGRNGRYWAQRFSLETYGATVMRHINRALQGDVSTRSNGIH